MSGFLGGVTTPASRLEAVIRKDLEQRRVRFREQHPDESYVYMGAGDLLLRHGKFWQGRRLPSDYSHLFQIDGGIGNCFRNAFHAAKASGLRYFEGVYATGAGHFTPHAWLLDPNGELLELTMPTDPDVLSTGLEARSRQPMLDPAHWGYWGVELHVDYVAAVSESEGGYGGTLDRPIADALFAEGNADDVAERRDFWPIYTYPYDPDRRVP